MKFFSNAGESEALARSVEDTNGVVIVPAFTGLGAPYWNDTCKGAIYGLTRGANRGHLVRAALEAMCYQTKDLVNVMEAELNEKITDIKVDGGASVNKLLVQSQSDILETTVIKPELAETTALGAARLAGLAVGFYSMDDFKEDSALVYEPQMDHDKVVEKYDRWKKAVEATLKF